MLAPGTRGDVAPFAGLGARTRGAGHDVVIVADAPYAQLAQHAGCAFHPVPADLREVISTTWNSSRRLTPRALRSNLREQAGYFGLAATAALAAAPGAEVMLVNAGQRDSAGERGSAAGYSGVAGGSDGDLLRIGVPHEWLFAQAAAVVHHAGAGPTATGRPVPQSRSV